MFIWLVQLIISLLVWFYPPAGELPVSTSILGPTDTAGIAETAILVDEGVLVDFKNEVDELKKNTLVNQASTECDYLQLQQEAEGVINALELDTSYWYLSESAAVPEPDLFGWGEMGEMERCAYRLSYSSPEKKEQITNDFVNHLIDILEDGGWTSETYQTFISDTTQATTSVILAHAGGVFSIDTIFTKALYAEKSVQFARVRERSHWSNFSAYRADEVETPCPCSKEIILEISAPFSLAEYLDD